VIDAAQVAVAESLLVDVARGLALTVLAGALGALVGLLHRWYARERVPDGLSVLVGLSAVAIYLNTAGALGDVVGGQQDLLALETAVFNVVTFFVAGVAAGLGGRTGDRLGVSLFAVSGSRAVERDVSRIVKTVGRVTTVEIPDDIGDIDGYDPVEPATKEKLAGQVLLFPRRLTLEELRKRFVERLRTDYAVGHVDVDVAADGTVEYLAVGSREAGIGSSLPPGSAALAVRADPPNNASPGDAVQVWTAGDAESGAAPKRVTSAELRGATDDVVTLVVDEEEATRLDTDTRYRLVTLPVEPRVDREFAAQLRAAEEMMSVVTVEADSTLANAPVGALDVAVVAIRTPGGGLEAIPSRTRLLAAGETVYVIARPDRLRKLERAAGEPATPEAAADD
jgi:hypothetical protein